MADLVLAAQTALFARLKGSAALQAAAPSFEYVPEDTEPPAADRPEDSQRG